MNDDLPFKVSWTEHTMTDSIPPRPLDRKHSVGAASPWHAAQIVEAWQHEGKTGIRLTYPDNYEESFDER